MAGKEVLAQSIHNASQRVKGPFAVINCGAMAPQILEKLILWICRRRIYQHVAERQNRTVWISALRHRFSEIRELDKPL